MKLEKPPQAVDDPDGFALQALEALIHTNFVHSIDAPSLSLIVPILHRSSRQGDIDTKKKAAQILGNMTTLADQKDLFPYLPTLVPGKSDREIIFFGRRGV